MQILIKAVLSLAVIFIATGIGKKFPSMAGLIGVMPLTGALVLVWVYLENRGDPVVMQNFAKGASGGSCPASFSFSSRFSVSGNNFPCRSYSVRASGSGSPQLLCIN